MARLIFAIMLTVAIVSFSVGNNHHVELSLVVGSSVKVRLIFLLYITLAIGMAIPVFHQMVRRVRVQAVHSQTKAHAKKRKKQGSTEQLKRLGPAES